MYASETDRAWAAGFYDGEGCTSLAGKSKGRYVYTCLRVNQKDIRPLQRFADVVGVGNISLPPSQRGVHAWKVSGVRADEAIDVLWPYLSLPKREQIVRTWCRVEKGRLEYEGTFVRH